VLALARLVLGLAALFATGYGLTGSGRRQTLVGVAGLCAFAATIAFDTPRWWQWSIAVALAGLPYGLVTAPLGGRAFVVLTVAIAIAGVIGGTIAMLAEPCRSPCARRVDFALFSPVLALVFAAGAALARALVKSPPNTVR